MQNAETWLSRAKASHSRYLCTAEHIEEQKMRRLAQIPVHPHARGEHVNVVKKLV